MRALPGLEYKLDTAQVPRIIFLFIINQHPLYYLGGQDFDTLFDGDVLKSLFNSKNAKESKNRRLKVINLDTQEIQALLATCSYF